MQRQNVLQTTGVLLLLWNVCMAGQANAVTRYADNSIGDCASTYNPATRACSGGSAQSFNTVQECVTALANPGDICYIRAGTYNEGVLVPIVFGTAGQPITISGYPGDARPIIRPPFSHAAHGMSVPWDASRADRHLLLRDFDIEALDMSEGALGYGCLSLDAPRLTADNLELRNCVRDGIMGRSRSLVIRNTRVYNCGRIQPPVADTKGMGIYLISDEGPPNGIGGGGIIEDSLVDGCRGGGLASYYDEGGSNIMRRNIIRNLGINSPWPQEPGAELQSGDGISLGAAGARGPDGSRFNEVYNNIIYNVTGADGGSACFVLWNSKEQTMANNTCHNTDIGMRTVSFNDADGITFQNNIFSAVGQDFATGTLTGSISHNLINPTTATTFVDAAGANFRLLSSATEAINQGTVVAVVTTDYDGIARPQGGFYDIGAFELTEGTGDPVSLSVTPTLMTEPETAVVSWANVPTTAADQWIGFYVVGTANNLFLEWAWMSSCTQTLGGSTPASGQCSIAVTQGAGQYEFRAFSAPSSSTLMATSETLTISEGTLTTKPFLGLRVQ